MVYQILVHITCFTKQQQFKKHIRKSINNNIGKKYTVSVCL